MSDPKNNNSNGNSAEKSAEKPSTSTASTAAASTAAVAAQTPDKPRISVYVYQSKVNTPNSIKNLIEGLTKQKEAGTLGFEFQATESAGALTARLTTKGYGIAVLSVADEKEMQQAHLVLGKLSQGINQGLIRVLIVNRFSEAKTVQNLKVRGAYEILDFSMNVKALTFKMNTAIKLTDQQHSRSQNGKAKVSSIHESQKNDKKSRGENTCATVYEASDNHAADFWGLISESNVRYVMGRVVVELLGPGPVAGHWTSTETTQNDEPGWMWNPRHGHRDDTAFFSAVKGGRWVFYGRQPDFSWQTNLWNFVSKSPFLGFFVSGEKDPQTVRFQKDGPSKFKIKKNTNESAKWTELIRETIEASLKQKDTLLAEKASNDYRAKSGEEARDTKDFIDKAPGPGKLLEGKFSKEKGRERARDFTDSEGESHELSIALKDEEGLEIQDKTSKSNDQKTPFNGLKSRKDEPAPFNGLKSKNEKATPFNGLKSEKDEDAPFNGLKEVGVDPGGEVDPSLEGEKDHENEAKTASRGREGRAPKYGRPDKKKRNEVAPTAESSKASPAEAVNQDIREADSEGEVETAVESAAEAPLIDSESPDAAPETTQGSIRKREKTPSAKAAVEKSIQARASQKKEHAESKPESEGIPSSGAPGEPQALDIEEAEADRGSSLSPREIMRAKREEAAAREAKKEAATAEKKAKLQAELKTKKEEQAQRDEKKIEDRAEKSAGLKAVPKAESAAKTQAAEPQKKPTPETKPAFNVGDLSNTAPKGIRDRASRSASFELLLVEKMGAALSAPVSLELIEVAEKELFVDSSAAQLAPGEKIKISIQYAAESDSVSVEAVVQVLALESFGENESLATFSIDAESRERLDQILKSLSTRRELMMDFFRMARGEEKNEKAA